MRSQRPGGSFFFNSLLFRNFLLTVLVFLLPLSGFIFYFINTLHHLTESEIIRVNEGDSLRIRDSINRELSQTFKTMYDVSQMVSVSHFVNSLGDRVDNTDSFSVFTDLDDTVFWAFRAQGTVEALNIYAKGSGYLASSVRGLVFLGDGEEEGILRNQLTGYDVHAREESRLWTGFRPSIVNRSANVFSLYWSSPTALWDHPAVIFVDFRIGELADMLFPGREDDYTAFLIDSKGLVYVSNRQDQTGRTWEEKGFPSLDMGTGTFVFTAGGSKYVISTVDALMGLKVGVLRSIDGLDHRISGIKRNLVLVVSLLILAGLLVTALTTLSLSKPMLNVLDYIGNMDSPHGEELEMSKVRELRYIHSQLSSLRRSRSRIEQELNLRLTALKQAKRHALLSQIKPHFLYNTLDTIRWMVMKQEKGESQASRMIGQLARLLKSSLAMEEELVSLEEEISHAKAYLEIQKIRYDKALRVDWRINHVPLSLQIPKLSLQPLLENALLHGIFPCDRNGKIGIEGRIIPGGICVVTVEDNGKGMEEDEIEELNRFLQSDRSMSGEHIGLRNVNQRIKLLFGEEFGIRVSGNEPEGLRVTMEFPLLTG